MHPVVQKAKPAPFGIVAALATALSACSSYSPAGPSTPPVPLLVQVAYCTGLQPIWVAFQDGDGPWTRAVPAATGANTTFQHAFQTNRGGVATLTLGGGGLTVLSVLYGAPAELATAGNTRAIFCGAPVSKTLLGIVTGLDADESAVISGGLLSQSRATPAQGGRFALKSLPSGPHDVVAERTTELNGRPTVTSLILRRDIDLPDSTTLPVFDFTSAEAFAPATATLTINGIGAEGASDAVRLITTNIEVLLSTPPAPSPDRARPYSALPSAQLRPGDLQVLFASAASGNQSRGVQLYFRSPADQTLTLPAPLVRPTITTVATTPSLRVRAQFVAQGDYDRAASINYQQHPSTLVSVMMTAAYAALTPGGYDLVVPDLSGAAGFDPAWALRPGNVLLWTAGRIGGTLGLGVSALPTDGATQRTGFDADIIPAP